MSWDFQATKLTILFNELPMNEDIEIILPNWYNDMKQIPSQRQPVEILGHFTENRTLSTTKKINALESHTFSFWHGIYDKWASAPKDKLQIDRPVRIVLRRTKPKSWYIKEIRVVWD